MEIVNKKITIIQACGVAIQGQTSGLSTDAVYTIACQE